MFSKYNKILRTYPIIVQSVQTGLLMGTADVITQTLIEGENIKKINPIRTSHYFLLGAGLVGPALSYWYRFLARVFNPADKYMALKKVAVDQLVFAPSFLVIFIGTNSILKNYNLTGVKDELKKNYAVILKTNYMLWPAAQIIAIIWNCFLSLTLK